MKKAKWVRLATGDKKTITWSLEGFGYETLNVFIEKKKDGTWLGVIDSTEPAIEKAFKDRRQAELWVLGKALQIIKWELREITKHYRRDCRELSESMSSILGRVAEIVQQRPVRADIK